MQIIKKKFGLQSGTQMQIIKKVLSAIRNSNADSEKSTSAIRNSLKKHDTLYSGWSKLTKNMDVSTWPLTHLFVNSLAPLTYLLAFPVPSTMLIYLLARSLMVK